ncbi:putative isoflavone reductase-like protein-like [Capsicum annuum]|nr:putative isoflavone reductase-like protein-like [Capsicum annuum]
MLVLQARANVAKDALLSDICLGTSVVPTYFPAHFFEIKDTRGKISAFDLVDGGVATNNPTLMAMTYDSKEIMMEKIHYKGMNKSMDYKKMLVLSLGTGIGKKEEKYNAALASRWGLLGWMYNNGATPLIDVYADASVDIVDIHLSTIFKSFGI